jgi:hypothetical protein
VDTTGLTAIRLRTGVGVPQTDGIPYNPALATAMIAVGLRKAA